MPQSVALSCGRARASAHASIADPLANLLKHDVSTWEGRGLQRIKERTVRSVLRGELAGVPVHLKVFRADTLADRARDTLCQPRGEREFVNLGRARLLGLPTVEPLACGTAVDGDQLRSFVVTRTLPEAQPFTFAAPAAVQRRVGALLRRIHDLGMEPGDLHADNLLVDANGSPTLVDLTSVRHGGDPTLAHRARGLAFLCHELDGGALDPAARELLAAYLEAGPDRCPDFERELVLATHRWRAHALVAFGRRSTRTCRHTEVAQRRRGEPRWHWHLGDARDPEAERAQCLALASSPPPPTRTGRRGAVWLTDDLAVKVRERGAARKLWLAAYWLLFARVACAPPVALCLFPDRGLVISRRIRGEPLASDLAAGRLGSVQIGAIVRSLGTNIGRLHAHGLRNRDLKLDNLVRDPASGEVCMVDLDGIRRGSAADTRGRGADLGRLLAAFRAAGSPGGAPTVRTFLRSYLRASRRLLQRPLLRRILQRAQQRAGEWASAHR